MQRSPTPDQWRSWLRENGSRYLLFARQQTRTESDAEDILQEAIVEAWKRAAGVPDDALVFATIRRRAIDLARSSERRTAREVDHQPDARWFTPDVESRDTQRMLELAVTALPELYREVVSLKIWGGLTFQEIAEITEVPLNTAASRYRYALEELRQNLKGVLS